MTINCRRFRRQQEPALTGDVIIAYRLVEAQVDGPAPIVVLPVNTRGGSEVDEVIDIIVVELDVIHLLGAGVPLAIAVDVSRIGIRRYGRNGHGIQQLAAICGAIGQQVELG